MEHKARAPLFNLDTDGIEWNGIRAKSNMHSRQNITRELWPAAQGPVFSSPLPVGGPECNVQPARLKEASGVSHWCSCPCLSELKRSLESTRLPKGHLGGAELRKESVGNSCLDWHFNRQMGHLLSLDHAGPTWWWTWFLTNVVKSHNLKWIKGFTSPHHYIIIINHF